MSNLATNLRSLFRSLLGLQPKQPSVNEVETILNGSDAVAIAEACVVESAGLSVATVGESPSRSFQREVFRRETNLLGRHLQGFKAMDARSALASALGMAMSGLRSTTFLSGPEIVSVQDQLLLAANQHLPIVFHLSCRTAGGLGHAMGSGHCSYHIIGETGVFQLFACNIQEAVDLSLIARRVAEQALIPGVVAIDREQTALSIQKVRLPTVETMQRFLGSPDDLISPKTPAQALLFGENRRRVPRWYSLQHPSLHGIRGGREISGASAAGHRPYFYDHLEPLLEKALERFAKVTGRQYKLIVEHAISDATLIIVAQGAVVETARVVANHLRSQYGQKVGVIGIRCLRPFPHQKLLQLLHKKSKVLVLERTDVPLSGEGPLLREIRSMLHKAIAVSSHTEHQPRWYAKDQPQISSAIYGMGKYLLRAADLIALCRKLDSDQEVHFPIYLGLDFCPKTQYPKRQALLDSIQQHYPNIAQLGLRSAQRSPDLYPKDSAVFDLYRRGEQSGLQIAVRASSLLYHLLGGELRGRIFGGEEVWGSLVRDRVAHSAKPFDDPGDDILPHIAMIAISLFAHPVVPISDLLASKSLLLESDIPIENLANSLPNALREAAIAKSLTLYLIPASTSTLPELRSEYLMGALFAALIEQKRLNIKPKRLFAIRESLLEDQTPAIQQDWMVNFREGFEQLQKLEPTDLQLADNIVIHRELRTPPIVRYLTAKGEWDESALGSLPRFWNQIGVLYHQGQIEDISPDPYFTTGIVPPLSSALRDVSVLRKRMPTFDALLCTGCGKCWASCPDSSLAPTVLSIQKLLESGISIAKTRGTNAEALALIIPKLAVRINSQLVKSENPPTTLEPLCGEIFDDMLPKLPFPDERKQEIDAAFRAVMTHLGTFPVSRTQPFFDAPEQKSSGTGEIFSLVLNPDTCKGCLICVEVCEPKALTSGKQTAERIEHTRELWRLWERLPDVSGKVIERASYNPDVGVLPAILLSRHCLLSMIGGDSGEPGSGMKIALRLLIASTEFHIQRKLQRYLEEIDSLRISITERIRELLVAALPTDDLSKLEESIDILNRGRASLSELTAKLETTQQIDQISLTPLQRLVTMAQELGDFHWKISQGTHGMGRARLGLLISPNAYSHGVYLFPYNSFQAPVVIDDSGEPTSFARGILEGHLREILEGIQLIRQARLELTSPRQAALTESSIMSLSWDDLDEEERSLCPPLLLVGSSDTFNDRALVRLLESDLPIKVLLGTDSSFDLEQDYKHVGHPKMGFWHLRYRRAFVLQSSIACYNHLADGFARSLKYNGPALLHIFTPSPIRGNFPAERTIHQAKIVVDSRAFPLFTFDPSLHGEFGSRLSLAGNPAPSELWASVSEGKAILPTDWLLTEGRFSTQFMPLKTDDPNPRELLKYLELPIAEQEHSTAYIEIHGDSPQRLRLSHALISMMRELIARWRILQELAGVISPFTEIIRAQIERDLVIVHDQAMLDLRREYEQRIAQLKQQHSAEIAQQLQMRLMSLAGYRVQ